jgi:hypothetical protein
MLELQNIETLVRATAVITGPKLRVRNSKDEDLFGQRINVSRFVEFVNRVRVGQACGMLYASDEQITTICY